MNNNICQFYIIFGNNNYNQEDNNVYINANSITNINDLSKIIIDKYKEKAKLGIKVGNEIIFLIPDEKYRLKTEEIIKQLKVNGKVVITPSKKEKQPVKESTPVITAQTPPLPKPNPHPVPIKPQEPITTIPSNDVSIIKEQPNETKENKIETSPKESNPLKSVDNIYRGTVDSKTYANFNNQKKNKSNKAALIIFIISLIFFIISLVLLFIM